jgi:signal transduction histidine kinase
MKTPAGRIIVWSVVSTVGLLLTGIGIFFVAHFESAIDTATLIARPHEVQTQLEHTKATLDALQDAMQDFIIDGADGMRYQYEDAVHALGTQTAELQALASKEVPASDLAEIDDRIASVQAASRAVIDARSAGGADAGRRLLSASLTALNGVQRKLDTVIAAQQQLLLQREQTLRWDVAQMFGGLVAMGAIVLCGLAGAVILAEYDRRRHDATQKELRTENERLEGAVHERSETLAQANRELSWFSKRALQIQEQERRNLALELHDQIGQELAALVHSLTRAERELPDEQPTTTLKNTVQESIEIARSAYGDVHNLALDLRPTMLDRLGLIPTLQWFARQQARYSGCEVTVEADAFPVDLPSDLLIAAFRIVQEAVSNAVRHAKARRIEIRARYRPDQIELQVNDDGEGFDPDQASVEQEPRFGLGLIGMRQRAQDAGGNVSIQSKPGAGTTVLATLAVPQVSTAANAGSAIA